MQSTKLTAVALAALLAASQAASAQTGPGGPAGAPGASGARDINGTNSYGETPSQANPRAHGSSRADPPAPAETTTPGDNSRMNRGGGQ